MKLKDKKILITGGAGFIGSNLTDYFLENENQVTVIDDLSNGRKENLKDAEKSKNFTFIKGDIRDKELMKKIIKDTEYIFHQAARASVPRSIEDPILTNDININGTLNILNIARDSDVERLIFASSSSVYGESETLPKVETMSLLPISPYGVSKLAGEKYVFAFYKVYGLKTTSIRYFNVYGSRQMDSPYSGVIPIWFGRCIRNENLIVFGNGEQSRDFTYIKDVIQINELSALKNSAIGEIFNGATSNRITLNDLAKLTLKITNKKLEVVHDEPRPGDIMHSLADIKKAQNLLGYAPQYQIEEGLMEFFNYLRGN